MHRSGKEEGLRRGGAVEGAFSLREIGKTPEERNAATDGRDAPGAPVPPHIR